MIFVVNDISTKLKTAFCPNVLDFLPSVFNVLVELINNEQICLLCFVL